MYLTCPTHFEVFAAWDKWAFRHRQPGGLGGSPSRIRTRAGVDWLLLGLSINPDRLLDCLPCTQSTRAHIREAGLLITFASVISRRS